MRKTRISWLSKKELSAVVDYDRIAELLGVKTLREMDEKYWVDCAPDDPNSEDPISSERDEYWLQYEQAMLSAFEKMLDAHDLKAEPHKGRTYELIIKPKASWKFAAEMVRETINGVGIFYYNSLDEFIDSGPYTHRAAVVTHLHWLKRRPEVYGEESYRHMVERRG